LHVQFPSSRLASGIGEEEAEFGAITTLAGEGSRSRPIVSWRQKLGDAGAQMRDAGVA
jgi:hypothetical protein